MRRLVLFLGVVVAGAVAVMIVNWRVDPFGEYYHASVLTAALARGEPCLISDDLLGSSAWFRFKQDIARRRQPTVVVVGSSRVMKIASRPGETRFANLGQPGLGIESLDAVFRGLRSRVRGPVTVYLGIDFWWLNQAGWRPAFDDGRHSLLAQGEYLLSRQTFNRTFRAVRRSPGRLVDRFHLAQVGGRCVVDLNDRVVEGTQSAWQVDGSYVRRTELFPDRPRERDTAYRDQLVRHTFLYGGSFTSLSRARITVLDRALALARSYGWRLVGFTAPYSARYVAGFERDAKLSRLWGEFRSLVPGLMRRHGFAFADTIDVRTIPCAETAFLDDGWHPDAGCAARVRTILDRVAKVR